MGANSFGFLFLIHISKYIFFSHLLFDSCNIIHSEFYCSWLWSMILFGFVNINYLCCCQEWIHWVSASSTSVCNELDIELYQIILSLFFQVHPQFLSAKIVQMLLEEALSLKVRLCRKIVYILINWMINIQTDLHGNCGSSRTVPFSEKMILWPLIFLVIVLWPLKFDVSIIWPSEPKA